MIRCLQPKVAFCDIFNYVCAIETNGSELAVSEPAVSVVSHLIYNSEYHGLLQSRAGNHTALIHSSTVARACADDGYHGSQTDWRGSIGVEGYGWSTYVILFRCPKIGKLRVPRFCPGNYREVRCSDLG